MQMVFDFVLQLNYTVTAKKDGEVVNHPTPVTITFVNAEERKIQIGFLKAMDADEIEITLSPVLMREYSWKRGGKTFGES